MRVLLPNLLDIGKAIADLYSEKGSNGKPQKNIVSSCARKVRKLLSTFRWLDQEGQEFYALPFSLRRHKLRSETKSVNGRNVETEAYWPPKSLSDVMGLLGLVQMAHYFIVSLSMGARQSEVLGLQRDCVVRSVDGRRYANGKTYKLVERHGGEWRDWQLPEAAVEALAQQALLIETAMRIAYFKVQRGYRYRRR
jgi:ribosomal protein L25 (general stress protein Ctc)